MMHAAAVNVFYYSGGADFCIAVVRHCYRR